mmetsp:Transcript_32977/g.105789  ORF Transcript_32977/g.105789 Transcript_32977/m.105789 type:complete len:325 (+) Transcript_32977:969-1943(+)
MVAAAAGDHLPRQHGAAPEAAPFRRARRQLPPKALPLSARAGASPRPRHGRRARPRHSAGRLHRRGLRGLPRAVSALAPRRDQLAQRADALRQRRHQEATHLQLGVGPLAVWLPARLLLVLDKVLRRPLLPHLHGGEPGRVGRRPHRPRRAPPPPPRPPLLLRRAAEAWRGARRACRGAARLAAAVRPRAGVAPLRGRQARRLPLPLHPLPPPLPPRRRTRPRPSPPCTPRAAPCARRGTGNPLATRPGRRADHRPRGGELPLLPPALPRLAHRAGGLSLAREAARPVPAGARVGGQPRGASPVPQRVGGGAVRERARVRQCTM